MSERRTNPGLSHWLAGMPGRWLALAECEAVGRYLPDLFGYYLVQVGCATDARLLAGSRVMHRVLVTPGANCADADLMVRGESIRLPVSGDAVDVVLLQHVLEFESRPHEALREAERVLVPEGHLIITGFNPYGLFGLWRAFKRSGRAAPYNGQFLSPGRMRDWLTLLGFDVVAGEGFFYRPPLGNEKIMHRLSWLDTVGRRFWPFFSGCYLLVARKRVTTVTPIKPQWSARRRLSAVGLAGSASRVTDLASCESVPRTVNLKVFPGGRDAIAQRSDKDGQFE